MEGKPKIEIAANLGDRVRAVRESLRHRRSGEQEHWRVGFGEYYKPLVGEPWNDPEYDHENYNNPERFPIYGVERYILEGIRSKIGIKKPVIVVDFGGMLSLSFLRIARELEGEGYISNGDVCLVVTNLNFDPNGKIEDINDERLSFFQKHKHLVHYIQADARELQRVKLTVGDDEIIMKGSVDYMHESWALTHGKLNDVDWPLLARALSGGGELISESTTEGLHPSQDDKSDYPLRSQAHELGIRNLEAEGLVKRDLGEEANYDIFVK